VRALVLFSVLGAVVAACDSGGGGSDQPANPMPVARRPAAVDAGVAVAESGEPYQYSYVAMGKRDPFRSSQMGSDEGPKGPASGPNIEACDEPLCQVDLDELKLVAVVSGDANPVAMVEDKSGVGHVVRRNTKVGRQAGKVTAILRDCIVVTSFVVGPDGRAQPNRQNLCVSTEGQGSNPVLDLLIGKTRE
jgi:type IV pilus assembly protein PilP